jgi:hypothetical protein
MSLTSLAVGLFLGLVITLIVSPILQYRKNKKALDNAKKAVEYALKSTDEPADEAIARAMGNLLSEAYGDMNLSDRDLQNWSLTSAIQNHSRWQAKKVLSELKTRTSSESPTKLHENLENFLRAGKLLYSDLDCTLEDVEKLVIGTTAVQLQKYASSLAEQMNDSDIRSVQNLVEALRLYQIALPSISEFYFTQQTQGVTYVAALRELAKQLDMLSKEGSHQVLKNGSENVQVPVVN